MNISVEKASADLPPEGQLAVEHGELIEASAYKAYGWGTMPAVVIRLARDSDGHIRVGLVCDSTDFATPDGSVAPVDLMNTIAELGTQVYPGMKHLGVVVLAEGRRYDSGSDMPVAFTSTGAEGDLVHDGTVVPSRQCRVVTGVLVSGWRYEVARYRENPGHRYIQVYHPASPPQHGDNELWAPMIAFNQRVLTDLAAAT